MELIDVSGEISIMTWFAYPDGLATWDPALHHHIPSFNVRMWYHNTTYAAIQVHSLYLLNASCSRHLMAEIASKSCWLDVCGLGCKKCQKGAIFLSAKPLLTLSLASTLCLASLGWGMMHIQVFRSACTDMHILTTVGAWKYTIRCVFWFTFSSGSQSSVQCLCFIGQITYAHLFFLAISFGWVCRPEILVHFVIWCDYNCNELQFM